MVDALAIDLGERFWANKSAFTRISFKVVLEPGSALHAVRLETARSERLITVTMDKNREGVVVPSSQVSSPTGAFDLPGLSGIVSTPGWSGTTSEGKPFYWRQIYIAESDPVTVTLDNATIEEYTENAVPYDPNFPYVFTEYSGKGDWVSCIGQFGGGNLAELVRRTSGTTEGNNVIPKGDEVSCCKKIGDVLKSIVKALKPILAVALVAFAAYAIWAVGPAALGSVPALSWMPATVLGMSGTTAGYIALGAALIVDGDTIANIGGELAEGVGAVGGAVIGGIGAGVATSVASSSFFSWLVGGAVVWFLLKKRKENKKERKEEERAEKERKERMDFIAQSTPRPVGREALPAPLK